MVGAELTITSEYRCAGRSLPSSARRGITSPLRLTSTLISRLACHFDHNHGPIVLGTHAADKIGEDGTDRLYDVFGGFFVITANGFAKALQPEFFATIIFHLDDTIGIKNQNVACL